MSFDDEWAQLVSTAQAKQPTHMQLNQTPGGDYRPGRLGEKLNVTPSVLRERANKSEKTVAPDFKQAQDNARKMTAEATGSMRGFSSDEAIEKFLKRWNDQVKYMVGLLGNEAVAKALRAAADDFTTEEEARKESFNPNKYKYEEGDIV